MSQSVTTIEPVMTESQPLPTVQRASLVSGRVLVDSLVRLSPLRLISNPVMLIVEITFLIVAAMAIYPPAFYPVASSGLVVFYGEVSAILLITVWFSTLADALAETQARNTASSLRRLETEVVSKKIVVEGYSRKIVPTSSKELRKGDLMSLEKNDLVPIDGQVLEGIAMVDESLLTGESTPVRKAPGDDVIGGSTILSDSMVVKVTVDPGDTYIDQMIRMVESSKRPKTPNEQAVTTVLIGLTAIFTIIILAILGVSIALSLRTDLSILIALYVCLLPTTIGALLPSIGLSGISRLYKRRIVAKSGKAVETAGDTDVILLDKTGTITVGNRQAVELLPFEGHSERDVGEAAFLSSWNDDTPEGRSLIRLAYEHGYVPRELHALDLSEVYEFSASTRTSGVKLVHGAAFRLPKGGRLRRKLEPRPEGLVPVEEGETEIIKGAPDAIKKIVTQIPPNFDEIVKKISSAGDTAIAISRNREAIGMIRFRDVLKPSIKEKIQSLKIMGIRPVMITGDQPLTAKSIAKEVAITEYHPESRPEDKYGIVKKEQDESHIAAMIGDGTNDAPALAMADVGLAMNSGTQAAKEAANMVDLESNPAKIIDVVMLGKQLLMTRGAVTTFSVSNDVAKYFAIMPVVFASIPELQQLNVLGLSMNTAVLSALIFNAVIIPFLIPLAMRGITFKPSSTMRIFLKNTMIYGLGGVIVPFVGIKLIDLLVSAF